MATRDEHLLTISFPANVPLSVVSEVLFGVINIYNLAWVSTLPREGPSDRKRGPFAVVHERRRAAGTVQREAADILVEEFQPGSLELWILAAGVAAQVLQTILDRVFHNPLEDANTALDVYKQLRDLGIGEKAAERFVKNGRSDVDRLLRARRHDVRAALRKARRVPKPKRKR